MTFTIVSINQWHEYRAPNQKVPMITVHYKTEKGFEASVDLEQRTATKETIAEAIKKDMAPIEALIGSQMK